MARYRARKAALEAAVERKEITPEQAVVQLREFSHALIAKVKERTKPDV